MISAPRAAATSLAMAIGTNIVMVTGAVYLWKRTRGAGREEFKKTHGLPTEKDRLDLFEHFAPNWDEATQDSKLYSGSTKQRMKSFKVARGHVLEVAIGSGNNFSVLKDLVGIESLTCTDAVPAMLDEAIKKVDTLKCPIQMGTWDLCNMPFEDDAFDTVMGSFAICSAERPVEALKEMARVCRPGGRILLLEHGQSYFSPIRWFGQITGISCDPRHPWDWGCYDDRLPVHLCKEAGLMLRNVGTEAFGAVYFISASPQKDERTGPRSASMPTPKGSVYFSRA